MQLPTYRRGQVEWALWRIFDYGIFSKKPMPAVFRTRIKRLLDLDRGGSMPGTGRGAARLAFAEEAPEGSGVEAAFTAFDTFCLALALDLLDIGFKQAEIVFLMRHIRDRLRPVYERIVRDYPPANRQPHRAQDYPGCPATRTKSGASMVDPGVFLLLRKIELGELLPVKPKGPVILEPELCFGQAELAAALEGLGGARRKVLVLEIGTSAQLAQALLKEAPHVKRGRPT